MKRVSGLVFYRCKRRMSRKQLAQQSDVQEATIKRMETDRSFHHPSHMYMRLASCLGITVDDLIAMYPVSMLEDGDQYIKSESSSHQDNCIARYRIIHNLRFRQLADRLELGDKESARIVCKRASALEKHVETLARYHGITAAEFHRRYDGSCMYGVG